MILARSHEIVRDRDKWCILRESMMSACSGPVQHHHRRPRGMGGASRSLSIHSAANLVLLCAEHHAWVESNRIRARGIGLLLGVEDLPERTRLPWHGFWAVLDGCGGTLQAGQSQDDPIPRL